MIGSTWRLAGKDATRFRRIPGRNSLIQESGEGRAAERPAAVGRTMGNPEQPAGHDSVAIRAQALTRRFGDRIAVDNLDLEIRRGELFVFLGPNGAGKTTTIRMLTCQLEPSSGTATVLGARLDEDPIGIKRRMGYLPEEPVLYESLTGREFLRFVADMRGLRRSQAAARMNELLDSLSLEEAADDLVEGYSLGMRKKLALIATLLHDPEALFWDEPTGGLDPRSARVLKDLMKSHCARGGVVFMTTHVLEIAERLADRVAIIARGKLIAQGSPAELQALRGTTASSLEDIFLELTEPAPEISSEEQSARNDA